MRWAWINCSHCLAFSLYFWFLTIPKYFPSSSQDFLFSSCSSVPSLLTVLILSAVVKFIRARVWSNATKGKHNNIIAFCTNLKFPSFKWIATWCQVSEEDWHLIFYWETSGFIVMVIHWYRLENHRGVLVVFGRGPLGYLKELSYLVHYLSRLLRFTSGRHFTSSPHLDALWST